MKKVFIIHGFEASPNGGWRPWLMEELEKQDVYACALAMPNPNDPMPSEWVREIKRHVEGNPRDHIYLVGHSLGIPAILRYLEKANVKNVKGIVLVSGPFLKATRKRINRFFTKSFETKVVRSRVKKVTVIHGDNDPFVPLEQGEMLAKELGGNLVVIENGGHLNGSAGWLKLPECLDTLLKMMR